MWRYVYAQGQTFGPTDLDHLALWVRERRIGPDDWIWIDEENRWVAVRDYPDLKAVLVHAAGAPQLAAVAAPSSVPSVTIEKVKIPDNLFTFEKGRRYVRLTSELAARYFAPETPRAPQDKDYLGGVITNLSVGGCGIETDKPIPLMRTVYLLINLPDADPVPFRIHGQVLRTAPGMSLGFIEHGIRFSALPDREKARLVAYLETLLEC